MVASKDFESNLADFCAAHIHDALGFVEKVYPWGEKGTSLEGWEGPDEWQKDVLRDISKGSVSGESLRIAVASGHGIGKTALIAWIIHWFISTRPNPQIVATANTKVQLETKTWREVAKWQKMALNGHWFEHTATKYTFKAEAKTWFAAAIPWSKERPEAFAGTHEKHVLMLLDEGSIVPDEIYETIEGAMTTPGAICIAFGNPTKNTGRFHEMFHGKRGLWNTRQIDSRDTKVATGDKGLFEEWAKYYGDDSDFFRVRVKGQFPRAGVTQLIPIDLIEAAQDRVYPPDLYNLMPKIMGVDVARFGDDQSTIVKRQGLHVYPIKAFPDIDTMAFASHVAKEAEEWGADAIFVDVVGVGAGVVDRLFQLGVNVIAVNSGAKPSNEQLYFNLRVEMWDGMKKWLETGGSLPKDQELYNDLKGPEYGFTASEKMQLERKVDMKARGLASPDKGDGLAFTFAAPVAKKKEPAPIPHVPRRKLGTAGKQGRRGMR